MTIKEGNGTAATTASELARMGPDYSLLEILRAPL
jgi:hypothetical protein